MLEIIDHELMELLEYKGEYACRYLCGDCKNQKDGNCRIVNNEYIKVSEKNNVCRWYKPRIRNPSATEFQFDDYLEFLMSDYYRPFSSDKNILLGRYWGQTGIQITASGGWEARYDWIERYKFYDKPYCRLVNPLTMVYIGKYAFQIDYRLFREQKWLVNGVITYKQMRWKKKPTARKYKVLHSGKVEISKLIENNK